MTSKGTFVLLASFSNGFSSVFSVKGKFPESGEDWQSMILELTENIAKQTNAVVGVTGLQVLPVMHNGVISQFVIGENSDEE